MKNAIKSLSIISALACASSLFSGSAEAATFVFVGNGNTPDLQQLEVTADGLTATITSTFNESPAQIGVADLIGIGVDLPGESGFRQAILNRGTGNNGEILKFSFATSVKLTAINFNVSALGNYVYRIDGTPFPGIPLVDASGLNLTGSVFEFGRSLRNAGDYSIASASFEEIIIPEPTTIIASVLLSGCLLPLKKRSLKK